MPPRKNEAELKIRGVVVRFCKDQLRRGPRETRVFLVGDRALVWVRGVLAAAELALARQESGYRVGQLLRELFGLLVEGRRQQLARHLAQFARIADPRMVLQAEERVLRDMAGILTGHGHTNLGRLLTLQPLQGHSLLAVAVRFFFRRAVEEDRRLFQGLAWATWENLAQAQERGFEQLRQALDEHGRELELRLDELRLYLVQIHEAVLDVREEQRCQGERHKELYAAVLAIQRRLDELGPLPVAPVPSDVPDAAERQLLESVLARYRGLSVEHQRQMPALLHAVGQLLLRVGAVEEARRTFATVMGVLTDRRALAEAHYHAYRAALERRNWPRALASYRQAATLDPGRWTAERLLTELGVVLPALSEEARADLQGALGGTPDL